MAKRKQIKVRVRRNDFVRTALSLGFRPNPLMSVGVHIPNMIEIKAYPLPIDNRE